MRRLFCILLLMLLPLHGFAAQGAVLSASSYDIAHEIEHLEARSHHHDDDGSVHYDESGDSAAHFAEHAASAQVATLPSFFTSDLTRTPQRPDVVEPIYYLPYPILERPQRPPCALG